MDVKEIKVFEDGTKFLESIDVEFSGDKGVYIVTIYGTKATVRNTN